MISATCRLAVGWMESDRDATLYTHISEVAQKNDMISAEGGKKNDKISALGGSKE